MTREEAIQEMVQNYMDLVEAFKEHDHGVSSESIQAMAVSVFIQMHGKYSNGSPAPANITTDGWIKGKIEDKKQTKTSKGTDRFEVTVNGVKYSSFKKEVFNGRVYQQGEEIEMKVEQDKNGYWNIKEVRGAEIPF